jgi:thiamine-phosphate pyrophosphorylase
VRARAASGNPAELDEALRLVAVTPDRLPAADLIARAAAAVAGGATAIWLRDRTRHPRELLDLAARLREQALGDRAWLIVSDRLEVALAGGAEALQLGRRSLLPAAVRPILPRSLRLGYSAHLPLEGDAIAASDFVVLGPVFETPKDEPVRPIGLEGLDGTVAQIARPVVAIGGIDPRNAVGLRERGVTGIAVIRAIFAASEPERAARELRRAFG